MRFTKLRIAGFKTFVEPTEFLIEPGLTGIVGPNGCGKSNLLEAMRWAMGESSSRNMRAADMDDVIFSGSGRRPARNHAEVTLFVDEVGEVDLAAARDADALEITRRIERGNGSGYKINGREVRARDVQILFADASTGSRSPAMVRQGQIGELIAAKPSARRAILEEASGISGLHGRRAEAEQRLKAAEQNFERIEDVLAGLAQQVESLERQGRQAQRYKLLSAEIRQLEATVAAVRWDAVRAAETEALRLLGEAQADVAARTSAQEEAAKLAAIAAYALPQLRQKDAETGAAVARTRRLLADIDGQAAQASARLAELTERLAALARDGERETRLTEDIAEALARLDDESERLAEADRAGASRAAQLETEEAVAVVRQRAAEAEFQAAQSAHAGADAERAARQRQFEEAERRWRRSADEAAALARQVEALAADRQALPDLDALQAAAVAAAQAEAQLERAREELAANVTGRRAGEEGARRDLAQRREAFSRLEAEAQTLTRFLAQPSHKTFPRILDAMRVAPGLERALAAALGDDLDASTDPAAPTHFRTLDGGADAALPSGVTALGDSVTAPAALTRRLAQIGVVDRTEGARRQSELAQGQRLVSREGDLWRWDGFVMSADAPSPAARRLEAVNQLDAVRQRLEGERGRVAEATATLAALEGERTAKEAEQQALAQRLKAAGSCRAAQDKALAEARSRHDALASRDVSLTETLERARTAAGLATSERDQARAGLIDDSALPPLKAAAESARATLAAASAALAETRAHSGAERREAQMRQSRRAGLVTERANWQRRAEDARTQAATLGERRAALLAEQAGLAGRPADLAEAHRVATGELTSFETARDAASEALVTAERAAREAEQAARAALTAMTAAREALIRAEERAGAATARREEEAARVADVFECAPAQLAHLAGLDPDRPRPDLTQLEPRLDKLKGERERMGAVNLRADQELAEVGARREALETERDELIEAVKRLRGALTQIDNEARDRLTAAFEVVQGHFRTLFTDLFGGGEAELKLVDSEDPLAAGLEIFARPPGKKPSTMSLLSGGEQALTAIALIFAVFLTNPAPVCVLDEVDAPLDDANVERWCDLLDSMAGKTATRFLVITHNPITMARMNRLFGVTMAERGVSQLVSVDLDLAEGLVAG